MNKYTEIKPMVYKNERKQEVLAYGEYKGIAFCVLSLGTHPCAYIKTNEPVENIDDIECNGGITYNESVLCLENGEKVYGFWIGWDYTHCWDYTGLYNGKMIYDEINLKKHTTEEMIEDCKSVIEQVLSMNRKN